MAAPRVLLQQLFNLSYTTVKCTIYRSITFDICKSTCIVTQRNAARQHPDSLQVEAILELWGAVFQRIVVLTCLPFGCIQVGALTLMRRWFLGCLFFVALRALFSFVSSSDELPCFVYFGSRSAVRQAVYSVDAVGTGQ